jgi:hypothetical protein
MNQFNPEVCKYRHAQIDGDLVEIKGMLHGNGQDGLVAKVAVLKEVTESAARTVQEIRIRLSVVEIRLASIMGALVILDVAVKHFMR